MSIDPIGPQAATRLIYPTLAERLTPTDLHRLFSPNYEERRWAPTIARTPSSQVALLVQLKIFQAVGRFLPVEQIPEAAIEYIARALGVDAEIRLLYTDSTLYRHHSSVLERLQVTAWGAAARVLANSTMSNIALARTDPADLVNAAVDALVRHRFELPSLDTLARLAGQVHSQVNTAQWAGISALLKADDLAALEALLVVDPKTQESPFAVLFRAPGRATRRNLDALIDRHRWLQTLPNPTSALATIPDAKVLQWANEARRLKAPELREYIAPRRAALLLAVLRQARGQVLDDLTLLLLKLVRKIEWKSEQQLDEWYRGRRATTDSLIRVFHESLIVHDSDDKPERKLERIEELFTAHGGRDKLKESCAQHLRHEKQDWRPFVRGSFERLRRPLLQVADILPLQATAETTDLLTFVSAVTGDEPPYADYLQINDLGEEAIPRDWRGLVMDDPEDRKFFNRRQLEVVAMLELAAAIKAGEMFVNGSLSYDRFWDRMPREAADPAAIASYAASKGWGERADGFILAVKESLQRQEGFLKRALGDGKDAYLRHGKDGRPIVTPPQAAPHPAVRHRTRDAAQRATAGAAITVRHREFRPLDPVDSPFWSPVTVEFADQRAHSALRVHHLCIRLRVGAQRGRAPPKRHGIRRSTGLCRSTPCRPRQSPSGVRRSHQPVFEVRAAATMGTGQAVAADGTHLETYESNLLAEIHIRYGKTGGIAYRHISDNYIALFSRFIACGTYEATYILDALLHNLSHLHPKRIHADTHGQSAAVFGLAYLLGIDLMPRIRRWKKLKLYRSEHSQYASNLDALFSGTVNWPLIREHYPLFMQLSIAIHSGALAPSAVLARINSYSTRNRFAVALQELGNAVRTTFLLDWVMDDTMRRAVHKCTTKVERHHRFAKHLAFGEHGLLRSNDPADQEKAIVYNELVANAVVLQNVVDQTRAIHALKAEGVSIRRDDLAFLSPYGTANLKRFGDYPTDLTPEPMPPDMGLPV